MTNGSKKSTTSGKQNRKRKGTGIHRSAAPPGNGPRGARSAGSGANPQQSVDRYIALARSAASSGDRVEAENYYQHAEHYLRLLNRTVADTA
jgi:hypothetical protein